MPNPPVTLDVQRDIAHVVFDLPDERVNKFSRAVLAQFVEVVDEIESDPSIRGVVLRSGKEGMFIAGADVAEIEAISDRRLALEAAREGQAIMARVEALGPPVVCAIGGVCLGGGTELALACNGRIGSDHPKFQIGLPEINLGLIPGWGGTTRLPRLIGLVEALSMILPGTSLDGKKAMRVGLIDAYVSHAELIDRTLEYLGGLIEGKRHERPKRPFANRLAESNPVTRALVFRKARRQVMNKTGGHYPAPLAALEILRRGYRSRSSSFALEAEKLADLLPQPTSKNLVSLFFLMERAKKATGTDEPLEKPPEFARSGVLGAGTMGGGIARLLASRDVSVRLKDVSPEALGAGLKQARSVFDSRLRRRKMTSWDVEKKMALITPTLDWSGFRSANLVLEAIVENMDIKKTVLLEMEPLLSPDCVIGTNTSTLSVTEMQSVLTRPARFAGFHFFNPVDRMPLIEVIRGEMTSDETVAALMALAQKLGKIPVAVADGPGFLVNRILGPYLNEAGHLLMESGDLEGIDRALKSFGMPMGPLRLLDEVGIDVAQKASKTLAAAFGERVELSPVVGRLVESGRLGKKTRRGFYRYEKKKEFPDSGLVTMIGTGKRPLAENEARDRCVFLMVAEASRSLVEGIVGSAGELDLAMVTGTGFPPFRGGLLRFADQYGISRLVDQMGVLEKTHGPRFAPPTSLVECADRGGFYKDG